MVWKDKATKHVLNNNNNNNINSCADITVDIRWCDAGICRGLIENALEFASFHRNAVGALQGRSANILVISPTATAAAGCRNVSYDLMSVVFRVRSNSSSSRTINIINRMTTQYARHHNIIIFTRLSPWKTYFLTALISLGVTGCVRNLARSRAPRVCCSLQSRVLPGGSSLTTPNSRSDIRWATDGRLDDELHLVRPSAVDVAFRIGLLSSAVADKIFFRIGLGQSRFDSSTTVVWQRSLGERASRSPRLFSMPCDGGSGDGSLVFRFKIEWSSLKLLPSNVSSSQDWQRFFKMGFCVDSSSKLADCFFSMPCLQNDLWFNVFKEHCCSRGSALTSAFIGGVGPSSSAGIISRDFRFKIDLELFGWWRR